jgi:hypothetical protein
MTKDDALGLLVDPKQPVDILTPTKSLEGESFDDSFASLPEN